MAVLCYSCSLGSLRLIYRQDLVTRCSIMEKDSPHVMFYVIMGIMVDILHQHTAEHLHTKEQFEAFICSRSFDFV